MTTEQAAQEYAEKDIPQFENDASIALTKSFKIGFEAGCDFSSYYMEQRAIQTHKKNCPNIFDDPKYGYICRLVSIYTMPCNEDCYYMNLFIEKLKKQVI